MLKRSLAVVVLFLGGSHGVSALDQRCGGPFDWLLCVDPSLSYSETLPPSPEAARSPTHSDNPAPNAPVGSPAPAPQRQPRAPLSLDYRVTNHASKTVAGNKGLQGHGQVMSKEEKEELYRAFLVWHRRQVINEMRDRSSIR